MIADFLVSLIERNVLRRVGNVSREEGNVQAEEGNVLSRRQRFDESTQCSARSTQRSTKNSTEVKKKYQRKAGRLNNSLINRSSHSLQDYVNFDLIK